MRLGIEFLSASEGWKDGPRRKLFAMAALAAGIALAPSVAGAQERIGDAALGALAGGLVAGPVGAVAGGAVGYTAGPNIARGMGMKGPRRHYRHARYYKHRRHASR